MILRDKFATPGYSSQLNPTHGRQSPSSRPLDAVAECIWDSEIWREKMEQCPVMRSDRRHIALSLAQDSVSLTVDKKGGSSMHLYVLRDESLPPEVARKHENLELLAIVPNTYLTVDGERRRSKSEYIPFTKHIIGVISEAWTKGCDVLDADSQPPLMTFCVRPSSFLMWLTIRVGVKFTASWVVGLRMAASSASLLGSTWALATWRTSTLYASYPTTTRFAGIFALAGRR